MPTDSPLHFVNVIDLECTCWAREEPQGVQEVIEIGITVLDVRTRAIVSTESILVLPTTSDISPSCTSLTTLTPDEVSATGISFRDALTRLKKTYESKDRVFASWGDFDRKHFERQCEREQLGYPFGPRHLNVKNLFALQRALVLLPGTSFRVLLVRRSGSSVRAEQRTRIELPNRRTSPRGGHGHGARGARPAARGHAPPRRRRQPEHRDAARVDARTAPADLIESVSAGSR